VAGHNQFALQLKPAQSGHMTSRIRQAMEVNLSDLRKSSAEANVSTFTFRHFIIRRMACRIDPSSSTIVATDWFSFTGLRRGNRQLAI
jgi:hypothetical protein